MQIFRCQIKCKLRKILLSTDFSVNADHAIEYALNLFDNEPVDYYLLHSYSLMHNIQETLISLEDVLHEQSQKRLKSTLNRLKKAHKQAELKSMSIYGEAPVAIRKIAQDQQVDLVVLGCSGDAIDKAISGNTTSKLIRGVNQPLLIVPCGFSWKIPKKIVLATDLVQIEDLAILDTMFAIARKYAAEITVLNITSKVPPSQVQQAMRRLDFNNHFKGIESRFEVTENNDVVAGLNDYVKKNQIDLLVLCPKHYTGLKRIFHKSVTRNIIDQTDIPVMVV